MNGFLLLVFHYGTRNLPKCLLGMESAQETDLSEMVTWILPARNVYP
jgi:Holliday junction resolvasome RuvABC endonuclease subunit